MTFEREKTLTIKGVLAIVIVLDHLSYSLSSPVLNMFRECGAPAVSMFLAISGFGLYKSYSQKGKEYLNGFLTKRIWKIILPALLAMALYYLVLWNPERNILEDVKNTFIHGSPPLPQLWFVIEITMFYLFFWVAFSLLGERGIYGLVAGAVLIFTWTYFSGFGRNWWCCVLAFPTGAFVAQYEREIFSFCEKSQYHFWGLLVSLVLLFFLLFLSGNQLLWTLCYAIIPVCGIIVFSRIPLILMNGRFLLFCGTISYELYLCHQIPIEFFRGKEISILSDTLYMSAVLLTSFVLGCFLHFLTQLGGKKKSR